MVLKKIHKREVGWGRGGDRIAEKETVKRKKVGMWSTENNYNQDNGVAE